MGFTLNDTKNSKYLSKGDVGEAGWNLTVSHCTQENLADDGQEAKMKVCVHWLEVDGQGQKIKPMVIGPETYQLFCWVAGVNAEDANTDNWTGMRINAFNEPTIMFGGKMTGGIRVRFPTDEAPAPTLGDQYRAGPPGADHPAQPPAQPQQPAPGSFEEATGDYDRSGPLPPVGPGYDR